jgi:hypothetical protein
MKNWHKKNKLYEKEQRILYRAKNIDSIKLKKHNHDIRNREKIQFSFS